MKLQTPKLEDLRPGDSVFVEMTVVSVNNEASVMCRSQNDRHIQLCIDDIFEYEHKIQVHDKVFYADASAFGKVAHIAGNYATLVYEDARKPVIVDCASLQRTIHG